MKKRLLMIILIIAILMVICLIIIKPKYELKHAVKLIKDTKYSEAYIYISDTENEENKKIVKEVISKIFIDYMTNGIEQMTVVANKTNGIFSTAIKDMNNIDYSSDDSLNIYVKKFEDYIEMKNKISKEMVLEELHESYGLYFEILEFINMNFIDILNYLGDEKFSNELSQLAMKSSELEADFNSFEDNYKFNEKTIDIYDEINI